MEPSAFTTKKELRAYWLEHRLSLSETQKNHQSFQIQELLVAAFPIQQFKNIHIFLPVHSKCEVRTWGLIHYIQTHFPHTHICVPKITDMRKKKMESIRIESHTPFTISPWGIEEPELGAIVPPGAIDLVLLPLLVFDIAGHRLGYGGGFYDRYLPYCLHATKVGLSYFDPIAALPEIEAYDIPMDYCVTPTQVHHFKL